MGHLPGRRRALCSLPACLHACMAWAKTRQNNLFGKNIILYGHLMAARSPMLPTPPHTCTGGGGEMTPTSLPLPAYQLLTDPCIRGRRKKGREEGTPLPMPGRRGQGHFEFLMCLDMHVGSGDCLSVSVTAHTLPSLHLFEKTGIHYPSLPQGLSSPTTTYLPLNISTEKNIST